MKKFKVMLCVIYILSPIDLVPEAFLGPLGLVDDLVVGIVALRNMLKQSAPEPRRRWWERILP